MTRKVVVTVVANSDSLVSSFGIQWEADTSAHTEIRWKQSAGCRG